MKKFNYEIAVKKLTPPIGGVYKYYAKIAYIYEDIRMKEIKINYDFGETYGKTKSEAERKMEDKVKKWVECQNK